MNPIDNSTRSTINNAIVTLVNFLESNNYLDEWLDFKILVLI